MLLTSLSRYAQESDIAFYSADVLRCLSLAGVEYTTAIVEGGGVALLLGALSHHPADEVVARSVAVTMGQIARVNDEARRAIVAAGGVQALLRVLSKHAAEHPDIVVSVVTTLDALLQSRVTLADDFASSAAFLTALIVGGGIPLLLSALVRYINDATIASTAILILRNLSERSTAACATVGAAGGADALNNVLTLYTEDEDTVADATRLLELLGQKLL